MTHPQQHDDPVGEGIGKVLQALAMLTTVGEAAARFAATGAQNRAAQSERQARTERVAGAARQQADRAAAQAQPTRQRADRLLMDQAFDSTWLAHAHIRDAAVLWRTAALHGISGDRRALEAMRRVQERLRQLNPGLVDAYQRHRTRGAHVAEAMRLAAHETWQHQTRPANGTQPDTTPTDGHTRAPAAPDPRGSGSAALDEATRAELNSLAAGVDSHTLDRLERQWRSGGHTTAADAAARLADTSRHPGEGRQVDNIAATVETEQRVTTDDPGAAVPNTVAMPAHPAPIEPEPDPRGEAADTAQGLEPGGRAVEQHLSGLAGQEERIAATDQGAVDLPITAADEHRDGVDNARLPHAAAQHDRAAAEQQNRLARAFPPLTTVNPAFSHAPAMTASQPPPTRRKGNGR